MTLQEKYALAKNALKIAQFVLDHCETVEEKKEAMLIFREKFSCLFEDNFIPVTTTC